MVLAICVARLIEVELAAPRLQIEVVRPAEAAEGADEAVAEAEVEVEVAAVEAAPTPAERTYQVQRGDTLGTISKTVYGTSRLWKTIHQANLDVIPNPKRMKQGATLRIPPRPVSRDR
jgi:nucleoid-associated protein YgaU